MEDLGITYGTLRREVGRYLGFDRDPNNWGTNETQDVQDVIDAGLRQFYRPPRLPEERIAHQWTFLRPYAHLTLEVGKWDYDAPGDFAGLDGCVYFVQSDFANNTIQVVNEARIQQLRQQYWYSEVYDEPQYVAVSPKQSDNGSQSGYRLMFFPSPDEPYTLTYKYFSRQRALRKDSDVPIGAYEHAETIRASCLAAAEAHLDDEIGPKMQRFMDQLRASVDFDRKSTAPGNLGYNGDPGSYEFTFHGYVRSIGGVIQYTPGTTPDDPGEGEPPGTGIETQDGQVIVDQDGNPIVPQG